MLISYTMETDLLIETLRRHYYLTVPEERSIRAEAFKKTIRKNQVIQEEGEVSRNLYFIDSGFISSCFNSVEGPTCFWLAGKGEFITSPSFFSQKRSGEVLRAEETTEISCFAYPALMKLMESNENIRRAFLSCYFSYQKKLIARVRSLLEDSAAERVRKLFDEYPDILQKVSARYAASYLGVRRAWFHRLIKK